MNRSHVLAAAEGWLELGAPDCALEKLAHLDEEQNATFEVIATRMRILGALMARPEAQPALDVLVNAIPALAALHFHTARFFALQGEIDEARNHVRMAAVLHPNLRLVMLNCEALAAVW